MSPSSNTTIQSWKKLESRRARQTNSKGPAANRVVCISNGENDEDEKGVNTDWQITSRDDLQRKWAGLCVEFKDAAKQDFFSTSGTTASADPTIFQRPGFLESV